MEGISSKPCVRCGTEKPLTEFHKSAKGKFGRNSKCIPCTKEIRFLKLGIAEPSKYFTVIKNGIPYKTCRDCKVEKHLKYFMYSTFSDRKSPVCRSCIYFKKAKAYESNGVIYKLCRDCHTHLPLSCFSVNNPKRGYFGRNGVCMGCMRVRFKKYREADPETILERGRRWREENPDKMREAKKRWTERNPEKSRAQGQRRRARLRKLDNSLTDQEWRLTCEIFDNKCALTGSEDISMDHFIPVSTGTGGTHSGNVYPLSKSLNFSKNNKNPFEWFEYAKDKFDLEDDKFERIIGVLAAMNCMRVDEFKEYVNSAFEEENRYDHKN